jgi:5-deoxy-5-amino-3-dehydroquinate dehydratase
VHDARLCTVGAIVNPIALMIAGRSLRDALAGYPQPWIEVHLSNVWAREQFRHESVIAPLADGVVVGLDAFGYRLAARALLHLCPPRAVTPARHTGSSHRPQRALSGRRPRPARP